MKKSICIFLCFLVLFISIPFTAFAVTNGNYSYTTLSSIMDDYNISNNTRLFFKDADGIYYCFESEKGNYLYNKTDEEFYYTCGWSKHWVHIYTFDKNNIYHEPSLKEQIRDIPASNQHISQFFIKKITFIGSSCDIYDFDNPTEVVFTPGSQGTSQPGVTPPGQGSTPSQNQLLLTSVIESTQLNQVLIEVVTLLPILIPTCITFLALRKGLKFLLMMLKQS